MPIIGFPRGAGMQARSYAAETGVDGVSCDTAMPLEFVARELSGHTVVQGNLDPLLLVTGGQALEQRVGEILAALSSRPFIFNLGHGIVPTRRERRRDECGGTSSRCAGIPAAARRGWIGQPGDPCCCG